MTRVQKERFASEEEYYALKDAYILDKKKLGRAKSDCIVLHPLPRVDEITMDVDDDPRAMYFKQAKYGMYARMAIILTVLQNPSESRPLLTGEVIPGICCTNPNCITHKEHYLPKSFRGIGDMLECEYCDERRLGV